jgi:hypothetical protein
LAPVDLIAALEGRLTGFHPDERDCCLAPHR